MQISSNMGIRQIEAPPQSTNTSSTTVQAVSVIFLVFSEQFKEFCSIKDNFNFLLFRFLHKLGSTIFSTL